MIVRRLVLPVAATALMAAPVLALPSLAPANQGEHNGPPSTAPNNTANPGSSHRSAEGTENTGGKGHGKSGSHRCKVHKVGYVASGVLVSWKLEKNADGTYSGEVTVEVKRTNHHGRADKGTTRTYKEKELEKVHVTFGLADTNSDGSVGLDDLKAGDRVHLIGKITRLNKKCDQKEFKATTTIRHLVFHAPAS
jgi:hypothetical protein